MSLLRLSPHLQASSCCSLAEWELSCGLRVSIAHLILLLFTGTVSRAMQGPVVTPAPVPVLPSTKGWRLPENTHITPSAALRCGSQCLDAFYCSLETLCCLLALLPSSLHSLCAGWESSGMQPKGAGCGYQCGSHKPQGARLSPQGAVRMLGELWGGSSTKLNVFCWLKPS